MSETDDEAKQLARAAFFAGFGISGEGWNAEYPFENHTVEHMHEKICPYFDQWFEKVGAKIAPPPKR